MKQNPTTTVSRSQAEKRASVNVVGFSFSSATLPGNHRRWLTARSAYPWAKTDLRSQMCKAPYVCGSNPQNPAPTFKWAVLGDSQGHRPCVHHLIGGQGGHTRTHGTTSVSRTPVKHDLGGVRGCDVARHDLVPARFFSEP